jgi:transposase-like protein
LIDWFAYPSSPKCLKLAEIGSQSPRFRSGGFLLCEEQVGDVRKRIPREVRKAVVNELRKDGMSTRAVAAALGIDKRQVARDSGGADVPTSGTDGKTYTKPEDVQAY